ncbi:MAG: cellulase family glycosylhydrolase [Kiritimatiellae bacterium]|nr:cellulase family glycosylhydrolase [Kiritimatiellia bacterium]
MHFPTERISSGFCVAGRCAVFAALAISASAGSLVSEDKGDLAVLGMSLESVSAVEAALDGVPRSETLPIRPEWTTAPLRVKGNRLVDAKTGEEVWLQGAAVPSLEWGPGGDHILQSVTNLVEKWNVNVVRLAVHSSYWFGRGKWQNPKTGVASYRGLVDQVADYLQRHGKYLVLDLHEFRAAKAHHAAFWLDAATRYKNHPGVIFGLLNEPHDIPWEVWRNGGFTTEKGTGSAPAENAEKLAAERTVGMQALVDAVRSTGAGNLVTASGLDWGYTLDGVLDGFALDDANLIYESHCYPWKKGWQKAFLDAAEKYPILMGEVGAQATPMPWENEKTFVPPEGWVPDMLGLIQEHRLNWTAWSFHPKCSPCLLSDWDYTPTPYWGVPAKRALSGERFPAPERLR